MRIASAQPQHRRFHTPRWLVVTLVVSVAIVLAAMLVVRALPTKAEVRMQIGAWEVPAGLVISSDDLRTQFPGLAIGSMLGKTQLQLDGGVVLSSSADTLTVDVWTSDDDVTYRATTETVVFDLNHPLSGSAVARQAVVSGDQVAIVTTPGDDRAILMLVGVRRE